jgi:hypothetical protein
MSTAADWDRWLAEIARSGVNLTVWEGEFVESMQARREADRDLTERQADVLERIYAEKTP